MGNSANVLYIYNKSTETNKSLNAKKKRNKRSNKERGKMQYENDKYKYIYVCLIHILYICILIEYVLNIYK